MSAAPNLHVTTRQLRLFEAVVRLGSQARAARALHVSQPTVSKQIAALETAIGLPLLEHVGKRIEVTGAGQRLYETARSWLSTWEAFEQSVAELKGLRQGHLALCSVTTTRFFMPRLLGAFTQRHPGIDVALEVVNRDRVIARIKGNRDDLYVMGLPPDDIDVESRPFRENLIVVIAPADDPLARERSIPVARLAEARFVMREAGSGTRLTAERYLAERGVVLDVRMTLGSSEAIKQAVAGGLGLGIVSAASLGPDPAAEGFVVLDVEDFPIRRHWYFVWRRGKPLSPAARAFLAFAEASADVRRDGTPTAAQDASPNVSASSDDRDARGAHDA